MIKKIFFFPLLCAIFAFLIFGCSKRERVHAAWDEENGKLKVLSTIAMIDNLVSEIGGEKIDHLGLIIGDIDPHSYELVKGDDEKIKRADLIFHNGLGLEHGARLRYHLDHHTGAIALGDHLMSKMKHRLLFVESQVDPHIWMDIELFSHTVDPIVEALSKKDPIHENFYRENGDRLKVKMLDVDQKLYQKMQQIPAVRRYLVTSHDAFNYFTRRYLSIPEEKENEWKKRFTAPEGFAPDGQMSAFDIQRVSEFLCHHHIDTVFPESNVNRDSLKKIISVCRARGHQVKIADSPLYGDTMGKESYLQMIEHNIQILSSHFSAE